MSQIQPVPGPSQDAFNTLSDQIGNIPKLKYMDLTDTTPLNVKAQSGQVIGTDNFVGCCSLTDGVMPLPYKTSGIVYIKLVSFVDLSAYSDSATIRVWYV